MTVHDHGFEEAQKPSSACVMPGTSWTRGTRAPRVYRDESGLPHKPAHHGVQSPELLVWLYGREAGVRGLAAHVDGVGAVSHHLGRRGNCRLWRVACAAVREG